MTLLKIATIVFAAWVVLSVIAIVVFAALMHGAEPTAPAEPESWVDDFDWGWPKRSGSIPQFPDREAELLHAQDRLLDSEEMPR